MDPKWVNPKDNFQLHQDKAKVTVIVMLTEESIVVKIGCLKVPPNAKMTFIELEQLILHSRRHCRDNAPQLF